MRKSRFADFFVESDLANPIRFSQKIGKSADFFGDSARESAIGSSRLADFFFDSNRPYSETLCEIEN